ncbi:hypothetical protein ACFL59_07315 [Planctomycetota bacterium]
MSRRHRIMDWLWRGRPFSFDVHLAKDGDDQNAFPATIRVDPAACAPDDRFQIELPAGGLPFGERLDLVGKVIGSSERLRLREAQVISQVGQRQALTIAALSYYSWPQHSGASAVGAKLDVGGVQVEVRPSRRWYYSRSPWIVPTQRHPLVFPNGSVIFQRGPDDERAAKGLSAANSAAPALTLKAKGNEFTLGNHYELLADYRGGSGAESTIHRCLYVEEFNVGPDSILNWPLSVQRVSRVLSYCFGMRVAPDFAVDATYHMGSFHDAIHLFAWAPEHRADESDLDSVARAGARLDFGTAAPAEILTWLERSGDSDLIDAALPFAARARASEAYPDDAFLTAFIGLEKLVHGLATAHDLQTRPTKREFKAVQKLVRKVVKRELKNTPTAQVMKNKVAELERPPIRETLLRVLRHYQVAVDDLWPPNQALQGLRNLLTSRNHMVHLGETGSPHEIVAARMRTQILLDRLILRALNACDVLHGYNNFVGSRCHWLRTVEVGL